MGVVGNPLAAVATTNMVPIKTTHCDRRGDKRTVLSMNIIHGFFKGG